MMSDRPFDSSAVASMLGYFYQVRYALYLMLSYINEGNFAKQIKIEGLDDIEVTQEKDILQLLQTKHLTGNKELTNSSKHFWKTIRIWSDHISNGKINPADTTLVFVINAKPSEESFIKLLSDYNKNIEDVIDRMNHFISDSKTTDSVLKNCYEKFNILKNEQKIGLISSIKVLALQPNIKYLLENNISKLLIPVVHNNSHLKNFSDDLDSWWFSRVVKQLSDDKDKPILTTEVHQKVQRLRDRYKEDAIPVDFSDGERLDDANNISDEEQFIVQLKTIGLTIFSRAKQNYRKAYRQRSIWLENGRFFDTDLEKYEKQLIGEFEEEYENNSINTTDEEKMQEIGRKIYDSLTNKSIPIHNSVQENYIMRGSYHILADIKPIPKVYWHPKFLEYLKSENEKC
jgi:hypothetical protein